MIATLNRTELPEGRLPNDRELPDGMLVHSLIAHALCAIDRHKWIESEKAGRDLGEMAVADWVERFWKGFVRARLMEHLYGWRRWGAFDPEDFGLLARQSVEYHVNQRILERVAVILADGGENLDVITWAIENGQELEPILWLLDRIDINAKRHLLLKEYIRLFVERT